MTVRHPPGRAGRTWLRGRLETAQRGMQLMQRRHDLLRREERRLATLESMTRAEWDQRCRTAERWMARALVLGGREALTRGNVERTTVATVRWQSSMGVTSPGEVVTQLGPAPELTGPAALGPAALGYRDAIDAAVQHAASAAALIQVRAELESTGRRLRAIRDRLVPRLEEALRTLELQLDEIEREEILRARWARDEHRDGRGAAREGGG